jgi:phospholipid/cholesterol/gamma-HCH transport system permease protein
MTSNAVLTGSVSDNRLLLVAEGAWTAGHAHEIERAVEGMPVSTVDTKEVTVDATGVTALDTFGAWLLERITRDASDKGQEARVVGLPARFQGLVDRLHDVNREAAQTGRRPRWLARFRMAALGFTDGIGSDATAFLAALGAVSIAAARVVIHPRGFRLTSAAHQFDRVAWQAVGIILLITLLIGGIIAQQGIFHFRRFGADDYVVDLVGILVLREIGVLIVAIMVAGRSGSSYTAELGSMKMREEIDALQTMGLDPVEILILPRLLALICALPILAFLGAMSALVGAGVVASLYGGMNPAVFVERLREAVSITHFEVGLIKAPFMALVIGIVAATEGLRVKGSAESLGRQTTTSVVKSIFLVIVLDGAFAIFFASIGM